MHFAIVASALAMATTVLSAPWKPLGGDLAYVGPIFNATFKAGDTIPLEYTFYPTARTVSTNSTNPTNSTNTPSSSIITATLTSLAWVGTTEQKTLEVALDNGRNTGFSKPCLITDLCTGSYYPKRVNLVVPAEVYPSNYTIVIGYALSISNKTIYYKEPVTIVPASTELTSPVAVNADAPAVTVTLPVFAAPNSAFTTKASKVAISMVVVIASLIML
ncbi:hypothetical protein BGZ94_003275 [Podila epigama]|nr:hypothetical protein BGZ94_003275 [Podila epigama]